MDSLALLLWLTFEKYLYLHFFKC